MFVQSVKFIEAHAKGNGNGNGKNALRNLSIHGQESNQTTLRLAKMNLAIRGIDANIQFGDSFRNDRHPDLKADYILANPPFNISDWSGEQLKEDKTLGPRHSPGWERQLRMGATLPAPPLTPGHRGVRTGQRIHVH